MCRSIKPLNNFEPPATDEEAHAAALQYVRKISGKAKPSQVNADAFDHAVSEVTAVTIRLLAELTSTAPPKNREVEAAKGARPDGRALRVLSTDAVKRSELASVIDHTILLPSARVDDVHQAAAVGLAEGCASVCVNAGRVSEVADILHGSGVLTCTVIGFPFGATPTRVKVVETEIVAALGAEEFDMVIDIGRLREGDAGAVAADVAGVRKATPDGSILKVILETATLTPDEIRLGCSIAESAGADFVKTSTGFHPAGGASVEAVEIMRTAVPNLGVKASGGIRDLATALRMLDAGASRLGLSATVAVLDELDG